MGATRTPWGVSQEEHVVAAGIAMHSTASHGGMHTDSRRTAAVYARFPAFRTYSGARNWFEEDQDVAAVVLAFPAEFDDRAVFNAWRTAQLSAKPGSGTCASPAWVHVVEVMRRDCPEVVARAEAFGASMAGYWEVGGLSSGRDLPAGKWAVNLYRGAERRTVVMAYPRKQFYSEAEIESAAAC